MKAGRTRSICSRAGRLQLAIYTTTGAPAFTDEKAIRRTAVTYRVPCITTMSGAQRRGGSGRRAPPRSDPRVEPAGNPRSEEDYGIRLPGCASASKSMPDKKKTRRVVSRRAASLKFDPVLVTSWSPSDRGDFTYYITEL